jgi:hypothetical protein
MPLRSPRSHGFGLDAFVDSTALVSGVCERPANVGL